jgi:peptide/nickel transport system substrate-binding protein
MTVRKPPMNDQRVTKALRLLLDHKAAIDTITVPFNGKGTNGSIFPASTAAWDLSHDEYGKLLEWQQPKDAAIKEALSLLSAAGFTKDNPLQFEFTGGGDGFVPSYRPSSQLVQAQWNQNSQGVLKVSLSLPDITTQNALRSQGNFVALHGGSTGWSDPDVTLTIQVQTKGSRNYTGYSDPKADALIAKQRHTLDLNQRKAAVREVIMYLLDPYPATALSLTYTLSAARPQVRNYRPETGFDGRMAETTWLDT